MWPFKLKKNHLNKNVMKWVSIYPPELHQCRVDMALKHHLHQKY